MRNKGTQNRWARGEGNRKEQGGKEHMDNGSTEKKTWMGNGRIVSKLY